MLPPRYLSLTVSKEQEGRRVDSLLRHGLGLSGTALRRAKRIERGLLQNDTPVFANVRAAAGDCLSVRVGDLPSAARPTPEEGPLCLVYEDEDILILDKPALLAVHPTAGYAAGTLANFVMHYYAKIGLIADFHPVSRLDRGTSGLLTIAKHAHAHERLAVGLHTQELQRDYLAVCVGCPREAAGMIDAPIARAPDSPLRREIRPEGAAARTHYRVLAQGNGRALVALRLETGRTHQIRVHLASLGCPLVGDFLYGREELSLPGRFALHSHVLTLRQPVTGVQLTWRAPLPAALAALLPADQLPQSMDFEKSTAPKPKEDLPKALAAQTPTKE